MGHGPPAPRHTPRGSQTHPPGAGNWTWPRLTQGRWVVVPRSCHLPRLSSGGCGRDGPGGPTALAGTWWPGNTNVDERTCRKPRRPRGHGAPLSLLPHRKRTGLSPRPRGCPLPAEEPGFAGDGEASLPAPPGREEPAATLKSRDPLPAVRRPRRQGPPRGEAWKIGQSPPAGVRGAGLPLRTGGGAAFILCLLPKRVHITMQSLTLIKRLLKSLFPPPPRSCF